MNAAPTLRRATKLDMPGVLALLEATKLPPDDAHSWIDFFIIAETDDGTIVGSAGLELRGDDALLRSVATHPSVRGTGIGVQLIESAIEMARSLRLERVYLLTTSAAEWFPRFGFTRVAREEVPEAVRSSVQFSIETCSSAVAMRLML